jgi:predicted dehydrogenase
MHLSEAASLVTLAERAGRPLLVAQNYRYMRAFRTVRRLVSEGVLGAVSAVHAHYYRVPHDMAPSLARLPHCALFGVAVHHLDVIRCIMADEVTGVFATSYEARHGSAPSGASLNVHLAFAGGAQATYGASYESTGHEYFEGGQEFYARFIGERGTLHVLHRWLIFCERGKLPRLVGRGRRTLTEERVLLDQMTRALETGEPADSDGRDNLQTMAVVEACVHSAATRAMVNPQELLRAAPPT